MRIRAIHNLFKHESATGIILFIFAALALLFTNLSATANIYQSLLNFEFNLSLSSLNFELHLSFLHFVNDALMAIFFLFVGLEIKRELILGQLSSLRKAILPVIAAFGGMLFPALIFFYFNQNNSLALHGWAIPTATDIAFSLGVLALLGKKLPLALRVFLMAFAIIDDLLAVLIIAIFYTATINLNYLGLCFGCIIVLLTLNLLQIHRLWSYLLVGFVLWYFTYKSGLHATMAGVILACFIPASSKELGSPLDRLEHKLNFPVSFLILPIFAFCNSGVDLSGIKISYLYEPIVLGVALGLFLGKQFGLFLFTFLAVKLRIAKLDNITWRQMYGISLLGGIGFTMSLFIATLAYRDMSMINQAKLGIIVGSLLSGIFGYLLLRSTSSKRFTP